MKWTPGDDTKLAVSFDYENGVNSLGLAEAPGTASSNPFYPASVISLPAYDLNENIQPVIIHKGGGVSLTLNQNLGSAELVSIAAFRRSTDYFTVDLDVRPSQFISDLSYQADNQLSEELQLRSNGNAPFTWTTGLYFFRAKDGYQPPNIGLGGPASPPIGPGLFLTNTLITATQVAESVAGDGQGTYALSPTDNVTLGPRYTHERRAFDASEQGLLNGQIPIPLVLGLESSFAVEKPTWRLSLDHAFTDAVMGYVSYNRGFKSGGFNPAAPTGHPYQTEQLDSYEVGLKSQLFDRGSTRRPSITIIRTSKYRGSYWGRPTCITAPRPRSTGSISTSRLP